MSDSQYCFTPVVGDIDSVPLHRRCDHWPVLEESKLSADTLRQEGAEKKTENTCQRWKGCCEERTAKVVYRVVEKATRTQARKR